MTVSELRKALEGLPDDMPVKLATSDGGVRLLNSVIPLEWEDGMINFYGSHVRGPSVILHDPVSEDD